MTQKEFVPSPEPRLGQTLRDDIRRRDLWHTLRKDFRDLKEFYIDEEKQTRLQKMSWFKRLFFFLGWILKSMLLKLTPVRRLLMFSGIVLILIGENVQYDGHSVRTENWHLFGGAVLVLVLMLELKDKLLARNELEAGRQIQHALMPPSTPEVRGWSIWLYSRPANEVGGDLVDFLRISDKQSFVALGDVSGKGLSAALLMAKLQSTVRAIATNERSLKKFASRINEIFHRDSLRNMFASLLYTELTTGSGRIRYVNAGHFPPILVFKKALREMPKGEPAIGLASGMKYSERSILLKPGQTFFAYSDGVIEARNVQGDFFGTERLFHFLPTIQHLSAPDMGEAIIRAVDQFIGEARANDDLSMIILKRT